MKTLVITVRDKRNTDKNYNYEYELSEIKSLVNTYYQNTEFYEMIVKIDRPNPAFYLGRGKVEEIKNIVLKEKINLAVININLNQTQQRNLKETLEVEIIDKTFLILEIFKQRARSEEGKLQVELARCKYELSKISGYGKTMDQQYGAIGIRGGAGERKIEYDRRVLRDRISSLNMRISSLKKTRQIQRKKRSMVPMPVISLVGYTNSGKSTLLNSLSGKNDVYADNKLFATLDPTSRKVFIKRGFFAVFTDTVGFINNLPHLLISAFSATLEEIKYSDLILHIHDGSGNIENQNIVVKKTLKEIGADEIPLINVFNKMDIMNNIEYIKKRYINLDPVFISAKEKIGFEKLLSKIDERLSYKWKEKKVEINIKDIDQINFIKKNFFVTEEKYFNQKAVLKLKITDDNYNRILNLPLRPTK